MAGEDERRRPASAGGGRVWGLVPEQSYKGKPIDPEVVERVRASLQKYPGTRSMEEREGIIAGKVSEFKKWDRAVATEYWSWTHQVKANPRAEFKLPSDPRRGMPTQEEYIRERVEKGLSEMRKTTKEYKEWVRSLKAKAEAEKLESLEAKAAADAVFNSDAEARDRERLLRDAESKQEVRDLEKQSAQWLHGMKERVKLRPSSAPPARSSGVESASSMAQRKKQDMMRIQKTMQTEYHEWLREVSIPKFQLPLSEVNHELRARKARQRKERLKQGRETEVEYYGEVEGMKKKHHARIMGMVEERLEADKKYNEEHEAATEGLAAQRKEQMAERNKIAAQSAKELKNMYKRMKAKPLMLESMYNV